MTRPLALLLLGSLGCGTVLNGNTAVVHLPPGATIDGYGGATAIVSQQQSHEIVYPDGRRCVAYSGVNLLYIVGDVLLFLVPVVIDAITNDWRVLDVTDCPGVATE